MIYVRDVVFDKELDSSSYLCDLPAVKHLQKETKISFSSDVTFFVGENGTGKSTLLEAISVAYGLNAEGGSKNFTFSTKATHSELHKHIHFVKTAYPKDSFFLRAESLYNVATDIDEMDKVPAAAARLIENYGGVSLHNQSHGESFLSIVKNRFAGNGLYILDEPEAALSPMSLLSLLSKINDLVNNNSQFIIATHSPILMAFPNAQVLEFSQNGIHAVNYKETEHYKITRDFLNYPERMLHYLLQD